MNLRRILILVAGLVLPLATLADSGATPKAAPGDGKLYPWPERPRPAFDLSRRMVDGDGASYPLLYLRSGDVVISSEVPRNYLPRPSDPHYSVSFEHRVDPSIRWGLSLFREGEFLPEISTRTLSGYLAAKIGNAPKGREITVVKGPEASEEPDVMFLESWPRDIVYDVHDTVTDEHVRIAEYFFELEGRLAVFTFRDKPERFDSQLRQVLYTINLMNLE